MNLSTAGGTWLTVCPRIRGFRAFAIRLDDPFKPLLLLPGGKFDLCKVGAAIFEK
jgi:hypothetical protein